MNILYIGSSGALSLIPFNNLLSSEYVISAVGVYQPIILKHEIIALENESLALSAKQNKLPILDLSQEVNDVIFQIKNLSIDIILMSCYAKRLPEAIMSSPKFGCFNMHPSLLPRYRGPEPIFWQMKNDADKGVSWHCVTNDFDAGDLVKTEKLYIDDGVDYYEITRSLAVKGSQLMFKLLDDVSKGQLSFFKQCHKKFSYQSYPVKSDFVVDTKWSAQHAYNFMKATEVFNQSYLCQIGVYRYLLDKAIGYDNNDSLQVAKVTGNLLDIPFSSGVLTTTFIDRLPND